MRQFQIGVGVQYDRHNQPIDREKLENDLLPGIRRCLASDFGGYTETRTQGGWIHPEDLCLVEEEGRTFSVLYDVTRKYPIDLLKAARLVGRILNQHSVVLIEDGEAIIVEVPYV